MNVFRKEANKISLTWLENDHIPGFTEKKAKDMIDYLKNYKEPEATERRFQLITPFIYQNKVHALFDFLESIGTILEYRIQKDVDVIFKVHDKTTPNVKVCFNILDELSHKKLTSHGTSIKPI